MDGTIFDVLEAYRQVANHRDDIQTGLEMARSDAESLRRRLNDAEEEVGKRQKQIESLAAARQSAETKLANTRERLDKAQRHRDRLNNLVTAARKWASDHEAGELVEMLTKNIEGEPGD